MKAGYIENHGSVENIKIGDVDNPIVGNLDILIKTEFAALNRLDLFVVQGWPGLKLKMPHVLGSDGSGTIKEIGPAGQISAYSSIYYVSSVLLYPELWKMYQLPSFSIRSFSVPRKF